MKIFYLTVISFLFILALSSCSTNVVENTDNRPLISLGNNLKLLLLPPITTNPPIGITQSVLIKHNDQQHQFLSKIEITNNSFKMVGLSPMGIKLFSIHSKGDFFIIDESLIADSNFNIMYLLADLQLTYWPVKQLQQRLQPASAILKHSNSGRQLLYNNEVIIDIKFSNNTAWNKQVTFHHLKRNYTVIIDTLSTDNL